MKIVVNKTIVRTDEKFHKTYCILLQNARAINRKIILSFWFTFKSHIMVIKTASCHRRKMREKRPYINETLNYLDFYFHFLLFYTISRERKIKESLFVRNVVTDPIRNSSVTIDWSTLRVIVF